MEERFCYIHKNTPELRKKLEEIGLIFSNSEVKHPEDAEYLKVSLSYDREKVEIIYCGENEEMFLALAATRSDHPYMQWFWYKGRLLKCIGTGSTITMDGLQSLKFNTQNKGYIELMDNCVRKATVEELVEYFNNK